MTTPPRGRILGIDPGTRTVGYAVVEPIPASRDRPFEYLECGIVEADASDCVADRLKVIADALTEIVEEFRPCVLAIEKAFFGRSASSSLKLGQARGAIMLLASQHRLEVHEYAPASIKQIVVGHGRATKFEVQRRVQLLCDLEHPPRTDAADALAIALCHGHRTGWSIGASAS